MDKRETKDRMQAILQGAFSGPPTPLKDIPKKSGQLRAVRRGSASSASAKSGRQQTGNPAHKG
jgi:hypothetical protein